MTVHHRAPGASPDKQLGSRPALLAADQLSVRYGETVALAGCSLAVRPGTVHAVIGENGSGKSSLVKAVSGVVRPSAGRLLWQGQPVRLRSPREAQHQGITAVFQETLVAPDLSVADSVLLGTDGLIRRGKITSPAQVTEVLGRLGLGAMPPHRKLRELSLSQRHLVSVARSLARPWRLLVLDEATSALDVEDRDRLLDLVRESCADDRSVLFISHRLDELRMLADDITVLRSGESVASRPAAELGHDEIIRLMSPLRRVPAPAAPRVAVGRAGPTLLSAEAVTVRQGARSSDLSIAPGEIVGLAGLDGHGQGEFLECLAGWRRPGSGRVACAGPGGDLRVITSAWTAARAGVCYVPRDRRREGLFPGMSVQDNLLIAAPGDAVRLGFLRPRAARRRAAGLAQQMRVHPSRVDRAVGTLSGGNQQKVLLGRWVAARPRVLLLNDPMRGVDVTAKAEIFQLIGGLAADGAAVVLLSTELAELTALCGRVAVFRDGALAGQLSGTDLTEPGLLQLMIGQHSEGGRDAE